MIRLFRMLLTPLAVIGRIYGNSTPADLKALLEKDIPFRSLSSEDRKSIIIGTAGSALVIGTVLTLIMTASQTLSLIKAPTPDARDAGYEQARQCVMRSKTCPTTACIDGWITQFPDDPRKDELKQTSAQADRQLSCKPDTRNRPPVGESPAIAQGRPDKPQAVDTHVRCSDHTPLSEWKTCIR